MIDRIIKQLPEVDRVLGKAGRAETPTDPAPLSTLETVITLKPKSEWRRVDTWYSGWAPEWAKKVFWRITPDTISTEMLVNQLNEALKLPGVSNAWTMPIVWATGTGSDVMKRIAAPMIGGIFTSFLLELLVYPGIYEIWKWNFEMKKNQ
jgi:Cu/Ag efflux pump CusA